MARPPAASVALIGTAGSGKSTLFSVLSGIDYGRVVVETAARPFAAHVPIEDPRVRKLAELEKSAKTVMPSVEFVDTPALKLEAEADAALLGELRQVDAYAVLVPLFSDPTASVEPIRSALFLADIEVMSRAADKLEKRAARATPSQEADRAEAGVLRALMEDTASGAFRPLTPEEGRRLHGFQFFTHKPIVPIFNVGEDALDRGICLKLEAELRTLEGADRAEFETMYGIKEPAAPRVAHGVYQALGLVTFYTTGPDESAAWPLHRGATAVDAAGKIHTDLARTFICAEVTAYDDFLKRARPRTEGKDYLVKEGDVIVIKAGGERKK